MFESSFVEVEARMAEELDYEKEAENTRWFHTHLNLDAVIIPDVDRQYTTRTVLATERVYGHHIEQWLKTHPPQEEKNQYGQLLVDIFFNTVFEKKRIHADPNFGNYLFREDGKLGLIDFGCVKTMDPGLITALNISSRACEQKDATLIQKVYDGMGIHYQQSMEDQAFKGFIYTWLEWITRPQRQDSFDFKENKDFFREGMTLMNDFYRYLKKFSGTAIYYGRAEFGLYRLLQRLEARVNLRIPERYSEIL
jgi:predicted unusual protein kinase regulating ubiquinone biosynthesis (AarF/ABC1/UbiB family)